MSLTPIDLALLCGVALMVGIGLYRGLSGELASFVGFIAAAAAGYGLYGVAHIIVRSFGFDKGDTSELVVTGVAIFVLGLVVFGLVRGWHGNPLQYSSLEDPMDRGAWSAIVHRVTKLDIFAAALVPGSLGPPLPAAGLHGTS